MRRSEVALHYAEFKNKNTGRIYRLLSSNLPQLIPGHLSSDAFGFFGMGSGERENASIQNLPMVKTVSLGGLDLVSAILYWKDKPNYVGFIDARPQFEPLILVDGTEKSFRELPINWDIYGRLGEPVHAKELLGSFARIHAAYPKHEQHIIRCQRFMDYVTLTTPKEQ